MASRSGTVSGTARGRRTSVVLADDDDVVRRAMAEVLEQHGGFEVVGEVDDCADLDALVSAVSPHVVVLDVRMPGGGPGAARVLVARPGAPLVVAVSATTDVRTVAGMLRAGACGFLAKGELGESFADDLARIARGHVVIAVPRGTHVLRTLLESTTGPA